MWNWNFFWEIEIVFLVIFFIFLTFFIELKSSTISSLVFPLFLFLILLLNVNLGGSLVNIFDKGSNLFVLYLFEIIFIFTSIYLLQLFFSKFNEKMEFSTLVFFILILGFLLFKNSHLLELFMIIECLSFSAYILAGFEKDTKMASAVGIQYLIIGSISSLFLILSLVFIYSQLTSAVYTDLLVLNFDYFYFNYLTENFISLIDLIPNLEEIFMISISGASLSSSKWLGNENFRQKNINSDIDPYYYRMPDIDPLKNLKIDWEKLENLSMFDHSTIIEKITGYTDIEISSSILETKEIIVQAIYLLYKNKLPLQEYSYKLPNFIKNDKEFLGKLLAYEKELNSSEKNLNEQAVYDTLNSIVESGLQEIVINLNNIGHMEKDILAQTLLDFRDFKQNLTEYVRVFDSSFQSENGVVFIENNLNFFGEFWDFSLTHFDFNSILYNSLFVSILFLIGTLLYKIKGAPFHIWAPTIYTRMPTTSFVILITSFTLIFSLYFFELFWQVFFLYSHNLTFIFLTVGFLSLIFGFLGAFNQKLTKKFFVYSSIGHVAFLLYSFVFIDSLKNGLSLIMYLLVYLVTTYLLWFIMSYQHKKIDFLTNILRDVKTNFLFFFLFVILIFSMSGIPPLAGFYVKFDILNILANSQQYFFLFFSLLITVASFYYYLRLLKISSFENLKIIKLQFLEVEKVWSFFRIYFLFFTSLFILLFTIIIELSFFSFFSFLF